MEMTTDYDYTGPTINYKRNWLDLQDHTGGPCWTEFGYHQDNHYHTRMNQAGSGEPSALQMRKSYSRWSSDTKEEFILHLIVNILTECRAE